ncbi:MAG: hypothetical protein ACMUHU_01585 [Thermoplasmatota archaeon]
MFEGRGVEMSPEKGTAYSERIEGLRTRIGELGKNGVDTGRIIEILDNLDQTLSSVKDDNKTEEAFQKFEKLLSKFEEKALKAKGGKEEPEEPPKSSSEKNKDPGEGKKEEKGIGKEATDRAPDEEQKEKKEEKPSKKEGKVEPEEGPAEDEVPKKEEKREEAPSKEETIKPEKEVEEIESMASEVVELGGDVTPIQPHIDYMKRCLESEDEPGFRSYLSTSRDWLLQYLRTLRLSGIESISSGIRSRIDDLARVGETDLAKGLEDDLGKTQEGYQEKDLDGLGVVLEKMKKMESELKKTFKKVTEELTLRINETTSQVEGIIRDLSDDVDTSSIRDELQEVKELLFNGEYIESRLKGKELLAKALAEKDSKEMRRLESLLLSIEPILAKIEETKGADSSEFKDLKKEQEMIIERSKTDPKEALKLMESFLDMVTTESAEIEENYVKNLQKKIKELRGGTEELSDTIDVTPIVNILDKSENLVIEGSVEEAQQMVKKASAAFGKLKEKKSFEVATFRMNEIREKMKTMEAKGVNISPLEEPMEKASNILSSRNMPEFDKVMEVIDQKLVYMSNEEAKLDYQKYLVKIVNGIQELKTDKQETETLEKDLGDLKEMYKDRRFEEAVSGASNLFERVSSRRLYKVINKRKHIVEETIREADGLLLDILPAKQKLAQAIKFIENKEHSEALDLLVEAQVDLEEKMTQRTFSMVEKEIRDLASECKSRKVDVGDLDAKISQAYSLADEDKFKEAMDHLNQLRESLWVKAATFRVGDLMEKMSQLIKQGRAVGIEVSQYKAVLTKSKVFMDAGDVESALELLSRVSENLTEKVSDKKALQVRLDKLRGNLIAQQGKISRLQRSGIQVDVFRERVQRITGLIDALDHQQAEKELVEMDQDINRLLTRSPEQLKTEMMTTIMGGQAARPSTVDKIQPRDQAKPEVIDNDKARNELFTLIPKIKVEITRLHSKGREVDEFKRDIETIQNLVLQKQYIRAYELGRDTYGKMTGKPV